MMRKLQIFINITTKECKNIMLYFFKVQNTRRGNCKKKNYNMLFLLPLFSLSVYFLIPLLCLLKCPHLNSFLSLFFAFVFSLEGQFFLPLFSYPRGQPHFFLPQAIYSQLEGCMWTSWQHSSTGKDKKKGGRRGLGITGAIEGCRCLILHWERTGQLVNL